MEMYKEVKKENLVLRQAQIDQEKHTMMQAQYIKELKTIIENSKDQQLVE